MPWQEALGTVRLRRAQPRVHIAEVRESSHALIVQLRERRNQAIALSRCQLVGVLSNAHHHRH